MPVLVLAVAVDLDELLEDGDLTPVAALSKLGRVVVVTVNVAVVLIIAILGAEYRVTERACEMVDVVFAVESGDVGTSERPSTLIAQQVESSEIVRLAKRVLPFAILAVDRKEFRRHNVAAVLDKC